MDMVMKLHQPLFQLQEAEVIYSNELNQNIIYLILYPITFQLHLMVQEKPEVHLEDLVQDMLPTKFTTISPFLCVFVSVCVYTLKLHNLFLYKQIIFLDDNNWLVKIIEYPFPLVIYVLNIIFKMYKNKKLWKLILFD